MTQSLRRKSFVSDLTILTYVWFWLYPVPPRQRNGMKTTAEPIMTFLKRQIMSPFCLNSIMQAVCRTETGLWWIMLPYVFVT